MRLRDQLAEFYMRQRNYAAALRVWGNSLKSPSADYIWLKALFWNRLAYPLNVDWTAMEVPEGKLNSLTKYIINLGPDKFWDEEDFGKDPELLQFLHRSQVTLWLRLIDLLKNNNEKEALDLLNVYVFTSPPLDKDLKVCLHNILNYRINGKFLENEQHVISSTRHIFFKQIQETIEKEGAENAHQNLSEELQLQLESDEAYALVFLAAGLPEAALQLHQMGVIPEEFPSWVAYALTQAYRYNRGPLEALNFASKQKTREPIGILTGELLIASGSLDAGIEHLTSYTTSANPNISQRASWIMAKIYVQQQKYDEAINTVHSNPQLVESPVGQELLGQIAMIQGDMEKAEEIYGNIIEKSQEAKSFFARQAYQNENWNKSLELTKEMLRQSPNNITLRKNLMKIIEQQEKE